MKTIGSSNIFWHLQLNSTFIKYVITLLHSEVNVLNNSTIFVRCSYISPIYIQFTMFWNSCAVFRNHRMSLCPSKMTTLHESWYFQIGSVWLFKTNFKCTKTEAYMIHPAMLFHANSQLMTQALSKYPQCKMSLCHEMCVFWILLP